MTLLFRTPAEIRAAVPPEPNWVLDGYLGPGIFTLESGRPKSGKSTKGFATAEAVATCAPSFLGRAITGGPVVIVSEETPATMLHKLPSSEDVHILSRDAAWPKPPWEDVIAAAVHEAQCIGAVLLIIDTAPYWAAMPAEREKDAGAALALMTPLLEATRTGLAVLAEWHSRKGAGDDGDALRGSNAFAGSADIVLEIEKTQTPRQRAMLALSRFPQTPGTLLYEHDPAVGSWRVIGEGVERGDARTLGDRQALLAAREGGDELTRSDLEEHTGTPEVQWHGTLKALQDDGIVHRLGRGVKGDPHRFQIVRTDSAQVATQNERRNGEGAGLFSAAHPLGVQQKQTAGIVRTAQNPEPLPVNRYEAA